MGVCQPTGGATHRIKKKRKKENLTNFHWLGAIAVAPHAHSAKLCGAAWYGSEALHEWACGELSHWFKTNEQAAPHAHSM
jgi:hypothetical protein